jgi:hypothetical protein
MNYEGYRVLPPLRRSPTPPTRSRLPPNRPSLVGYRQGIGRVISLYRYIGIYLEVYR